MTSVLHRRAFRTALLTIAALSAITGTLVVAYELALARVPEHRATLERLVRAQTGLDVRFNELGLRWGWNGPEAVFRRVELGEPGRSNVLLRAPQLIVGFDAWRTMQTGQLAAGRITLIAPDIDLERLTHEAPAQSGVPSQPGSQPTARNGGAASLASRARILERWRGGRIDLQGGTLRVPDPNGSNNPLTVQVRRVSLRHAENEWSGFGLVYLPERLGRAARLAVQIQGDLDRPQTWSGGIRFDGNRLAFAGWREALGNYPTFARSLPATGSGDLTFQLTLKDGRLEKGSGDLKANDLSFGTPPWVDRSQALFAAHGTLNLDYVAGKWSYVRRAEGGQVQVEQIALSRDSKAPTVPNVSVEFGAGHIHGNVTSVPLKSVAAVAQWLAPSLIPAGVELKGAAENFDFDWNPARVAGERLAASARIDDATVKAASGRFSLSGLKTLIVGSESRVVIEVAAPAARLAAEAVGREPLEALKLAAVLQMKRGDAGWQLSTDRFEVEHDAVEMQLSGTLTAGEGEDAALLDMQGSVAHADVAKIRDVWPEEARRSLGPAFARLQAGKIEDAKFSWQGRLNQSDTTNTADAFKGSLMLKEARIAGEGAWPETRAVDARVEWTGSMIRASLDEGHAGPFDLEDLQAQWDAKGTRASHIAGRARAKVEKALAWVGAHPELQEYAPHLQALAAKGDALFDFDVSIPRERVLAPRGTPPKTRARIATLLEDVQLAVAPQFPPIEGLRGTLAFDSGRLQKSTLNATWLGGPVTLKIAEKRDRSERNVSVQAQGFIDAGKVIALSELQRLPAVSGETAWSGEFLYSPPVGEKPARWQGRIDSNLVGVASEWPAPLGKVSEASLPLHVELTGSGDATEVRANLAERIRSTFSLALDGQGMWQIDHGNVRVAAGSTASGARQYVNAILQASAGSDGTDVRVESESVGLVTATLFSGSSGISLKDVKWSRETLAGEGDVKCAPGLASCEASFDVTTESLARALADLGFRPDVAAAQGSLKGSLTWTPRSDRSWLETASGQLTLRFEDGIARSDVSSAGRPFPLLTVPALLSGITRPSAPDSMGPGDMRFRSLDAQFELRDGHAYTSNLHFDGDAEILMRGRTGLLAHDYDHEAWVLRGEERIPASLRRLAATPRVAAAWMALRDLIRADGAGRSHVVLHLRGSWTDPIVTVD